MSFDAHNLIVPQAGLSSGGSPGGAKSPEASDASHADIKARFDLALTSQSDVTPAIPGATESALVEAVTETAPVVFPQMFAMPVSGEILPDTVSDMGAEVSSVMPADLLPETAPQAETEAASRSDVQTLMDARTTAENAQVPVETGKDDIKATGLDLAAVLMAAQLAASESSAEPDEATAIATDADLEALLKTLPPELAALLQATAKPAANPAAPPVPAKDAPVKDAPANSLSAKLESGLALLPDNNADKTVNDPAFSAVKDITATAEGAEDAALPASVAASAQGIPAQTSQSDAQALINNLSSRLNGATAASSVSSAATAQAYVMSNQTADNIAALAAQIHKKMDGKTLRFDMELRPSDMGRVDVRMEINADGKLSAHLSFDSPVAETEFRGRQDDLRRQLEQSGFNLEDGSLSFSSRDQNPQQSARDPRDPPAVTATAASAQFSHTDTAADELDGWFAGRNDMGGRLALNVRV